MSPQSSSYPCAEMSSSPGQRSHTAMVLASKQDGTCPYVSKEDTTK